MTATAILTLSLIACKDGETPSDDSAEVETRATISGSLTWTMDKNSQAEAAGDEDCSYTHTYTGVEDRSAPWICQDCELMFSLDVEEDDPERCYRSVTYIDEAPQSWIAYKAGRWYFASENNFVEMGNASFDGQTLELLDGSTTLSLSRGEATAQTSGSLTVGSEPGDTMNGWADSETYSCGWPKSDPPAYEGDYLLVEDGPLPDGLMNDTCGEPVRLHNLASGRYTVIELGALDCGPCQAFAQGEEAFVADLAADGIEVTVITLMVDSVEGPGTTASLEGIQDWKSRFSLSNPVLADRRWGVSVLGNSAHSEFPFIILMNPEMQVMLTYPGYNESVFPVGARLIRQDAAE